MYVGDVQVPYPEHTREEPSVVSTSGEAEPKRSGTHSVSLDTRVSSEGETPTHSMKELVPFQTPEGSPESLWGNVSPEHASNSGKLAPTSLAQAVSGDTGAVPTDGREGSRVSHGWVTSGYVHPTRTVVS